MNNINIDIDKLKALLERLNKYTNTYNYEINEFFRLLKSNEIWSGASADEYREYVDSNKNKYYLFGETLQKYLVDMSKIVDLLEKRINQNVLE